MSPDETVIISNVLKTAVSFDKALNKAKLDGVIDDDERVELDKIRKKIFEEAANIAEKDEIITQEETKLLDKLLEIIISLKDEYKD